MDLLTPTRIRGENPSKPFLRLSSVCACVCFADESLQEFSSFLRNLEDQRELMVGLPSHSVSALLKYTKKKQQQQLRLLIISTESNEPQTFLLSLTASHKRQVLKLFYFFKNPVINLSLEHWTQSGNTWSHSAPFSVAVPSIGMVLRVWRKLTQIQRACVKLISLHPLYYNSPLTITGINQLPSGTHGHFIFSTLVWNHCN